MSKREEPRRDRRQWLAGSLRYAAVAGISVFSAGLLARGGANADGRECPTASECGNCRARRDCNRAERE